MRILVLLISVLLITTLSHAENLNFKPLKMAVNLGDSLEITGFTGAVTLEHDEKATGLSVFVTQKSPEKVQDYAKEVLDEWNFNLVRKGTVIQLKVQTPHGKQSWNQIVMSGGAPKFFIRVKGPALPTEINWYDGQVKVINWKSSVAVTQQSGRLFVKGGEGALKLFVQEGAVTISDRKGQVDLESYNAAIKLENIKGQVNIENFSGSSNVNKIDGQVHLVSFKGSSQIAGSKGRIEFINGFSALKIDSFEGEVRGKSGQGSVSANLKGDVNVRIHSEEGPVSIRVPSSGAWVNVGTADGVMYVPNFLKLTRYPSIKVRQGRLRGRLRGSIFVRTGSGNIRIR